MQCWRDTFVSHIFNTTTHVSEVLDTLDEFTANFYVKIRIKMKCGEWNSKTAKQVLQGKEKPADLCYGL